MTLDDALECARVLLESWNWSHEGTLPSGEHAYSVAVDVAGRCCRLELRIDPRGSVRSRASEVRGAHDDGSDDNSWQVISFDPVAPAQLELAMLEAVGATYEECVV